MSFIHKTNQDVAQLIDANLDRAREGLRVIEDWSRFGLNNKAFVIILKDWRQQLGREHHEFYKKARSTSTDRGAGLKHPAQSTRVHPKEIVAANFARVQEALRVLEEFTRITHPELSRISADIRYKVYDLEIDILKASNHKIRLKILNNCNLCLITRPHPQLLKTVSLALKAGVRMVQFRCKEGTDLENIRLAKDIASSCKSHNSLFIINDRIDIAIASNADGIHLGQEDIPIKIARELVGPEKIIGLSTHSVKQIESAEKEPCDYLGVGPIYKSHSKPNEKSIGTDFIKKVANQINIPWFAIGGINKVNISEINRLGARKIALINAIMSAEDPYTASKELLEKIK